jgi:iron complex transport system ATP-binding protein
MSDLRAEDVHVQLGAKQVLSGARIAFAPGSITAILGPNGAGKSTLLSCLAGLRTPDRGHCTLNGVDLATLAARARAREIAFLAQNPEVAWAVTVRTLVGLGRTPFLGARGATVEDAAAVDEALALTGSTVLGERIVTTLSGGERARVLLARALAGRPKWLLADEPLTGLDPGHQLDAANLFRRVARAGCGVVVTMHDLQMAARLADRIVLLVDGRIFAEGDALAVLSEKNLRAAYGVSSRIVQGAHGPMIDVVGRAP